MRELNQKWRIVIYSTLVSAVFTLCFFLNFPPAISKALLLVILMTLFYLDQDPASLIVYGGLGVIYMGLFAWFTHPLSTTNDYLLWLVELFLYCALYFVVALFSRKLKALYNISKLHELVIADTTAGLWTWEDMTKDNQWWSPRYYKLLGYENNEIPATLKNLSDLIHPDDRDAAFKVLQDYIAGNCDTLESEYRIRTKSGEYKWFLGSGEVQFEKDSRKPRRIVGSIVDIDHKKQHEITLASQAALIAISPDAIITTDPEFNVRSWNEGAEKLYEIKAGDAIGKNVRELLNTSYPYSTESLVAEEFANSDSWRGEAHQITRNGKKVYVLSSVRLIRDTLGQPTGVLAVNSDISLLRINNELSAALKMLESSTQYIEQLAYISSHDLRSPIITLQGLMNHLAASKAIAPGHVGTFDMLRDIVENMKSTSVALTSILQLRKNLTSREFATDNVAISLVVNDVQEMLKSQIAATSAEINVNVEKGLHVRIHNSFMRSMLYNLVSNSIKFRQPGRTPVISINAYSENNFIYIVVKDNGSGINLERYQNKLFTIFTRFHDEMEGNGVGLHSVKMIVDFYKGEIKVESKEEEGTSITIKLPIEEANG